MSTDAYRWTKVVADFVGQGDVRHRGRHVFAVIQQRHDAGVQTF